MKELRKQVDKLYFEAFEASRAWYKASVFVERHSLVLARGAEAVAKQMCKQGNAEVDPDAAYICGLMHDIGKASKEHRGLNHPILGYEFLMEQAELSEKGEGRWASLSSGERIEAKRIFQLAAQIAMTHSWYAYPDINNEAEFGLEMDPETSKQTWEYMDGVELTDYDRLIQLLDNMAHQSGMMSISDRFGDIIMRHDSPNAGAHLRELVRLKLYFDKKCGMNIYKLFESDIIRTAMQEPNEPDGEEPEIKIEV